MISITNSVGVGAFDNPRTNDLRNPAAVTEANVLISLPPGGRGTTKWWKESAEF